MNLSNTLLGKIAALALTALAILAIHALFIAPVAARLSSAQEQLDEQRRLLGRYVASRESTNAQTPTDASALKSLNSILLPGDNEQIKTASLQARATNAAANVGIRLGSLTTVAARDKDNVRVVGVEVQFQASLRHVLDMLIGFETQQPIVFVDMLQISKAPDAEVRPGRELDVRLVLLGVAGKAEDTP